MKISVLIATAGSDRALVDALASVRAQSHRDWEIIVADFGPPRDLGTLVSDFARHASQGVHYELLPAGGVPAAARNRLLELATGELFAFLDPGTTWAARHLAGAAVSLGAADVIVSDIQLLERRTGRLVNVPAPAHLVANPVRTLFARNAIASPSTVVFRRSLAQKVGAFDQGFRDAETHDFWLRCALHNARFVLTRRATCLGVKERVTTAQALVAAEQAVLFYEKHHDIAAVPAALRRRALAASLVAHGRLLRSIDPAKAARCFWRAWSLQPVDVQTLGQYALTGWHDESSSGSAPPPAGPAPPSHSEIVGNGPPASGNP